MIIHFRWTADDLLQGYRYHFRHICRPGFRFGLNFLFGVVLVGGVLGLTTSGPEGKASPVVAIGFLAVGVYWFVFRRFERRWSVHRQFKKRPDCDANIEWRATPDKINTQSALGNSDIQWQAFTKMLRTPDGIMLYPNEQIYHWLPRRGFVSDAEFERFVVLVASKIQTRFNIG